MSRAQLLFSVALGAVAVLVAVVGTYVASSPAWGSRWYRERRRREPGPESTGGEEGGPR